MHRSLHSYDRKQIWKNFLLKCSCKMSWKILVLNWYSLSLLNECLFVFYFDFHCFEPCTKCREKISKQQIWWKNSTIEFLKDVVTKSYLNFIISANHQLNCFQVKITMTVIHFETLLKANSRILIHLKVIFMSRKWQLEN